jgi:hypothetical protein
MTRLVFSWNIKADAETAYFEFVVQELAPKLVKLGIRPTEAWYTVYGAGPQIIMPAVVADHESLDQVLASEQWRELIERLKTFVTDYQLHILDERS